MGGPEQAHRAREGERLSASRRAAYTAEQADAWGSAPWERLAGQNAEAHDLLLAALAPAPGERLLDVGTGTGRLAVEAARAGAAVTGVDLAPGLVETARRLAAEEAVEVAFDVADVERLPYPDSSFDVVTSAFGAMFALDERAAAGELARVVRPGGRLGLTTIADGSAGADLWRLVWRYDPRPADASDPIAWGRPEHLHALLDEHFELTVEPVEISPHPERDPEEVWEIFSASFGPVRALLARLDADEVAAFRRAYLDHLESRLPRLNIVAVGIRR